MPALFALALFALALLALAPFALAPFALAVLFALFEVPESCSVAADGAPGAAELFGELVVELGGEDWTADLSGKLVSRAEIRLPWFTSFSSVSIGGDGTMAGGALTALGPIPVGPSAVGPRSGTGRSGRYARDLCTDVNWCCRWWRNRRHRRLRRLHWRLPRAARICCESDRTD